MADAKISALTNLTAADPTNDMIPIVDVSDTPPASGNTKRISINNILSSSPTASGALTVTGLVTAGSATITGAATVGTTLGVTGVSSFAAGTAALPALTRTGDTNTGIYYPAADTFAVTTGGTERVRVNSSGQIGFGVVPEAWGGDFKALQLGYPNFIAGNDGAYRLDMGVNAYYDGFYKYAASSVAASLYTQASGAHSWSTKTSGTAGNPVNFTPAMSLDASGNLSLPTGNVVMGTSGKGIDFSATANSSGTMTSELLNDYEEGTWQGVLTGTTIAGTGVYSAQTGQYTKIGRTVFLNLYLEWSAHTGTGNMSITGLPFTCSSAASAYSAGSIGFFDNIALTAANVPFAHITPGSAVITLRQLPSGGGANAVIPMDAAGGMIVNISYNV